MQLMIGLSVILLIIVIRLVIHIRAIKKEMKNLKNELYLTRDKSYNRMLTISLIDKDLSALTAEMNKNLDYQKQLKLSTEKSERALKQSVSDIAHDLRTPLTVIKGNLQLLETEEQLSDHALEHIRICSQRADAMKTMADDFFELSVLESDHTPVILMKVNITNLMMQLIADNEAVIRSKGIYPDIILPDKTVFISADEKMVMRMCENLLNNVLKYAEESFTAEISVSDNICTVTFSNPVYEGRIIDTDRLFDRTYRADKARQGTGAGLGLYIVKLLAEKQNGKVNARLSDNRLYMSMSFALYK